LSMACDRLAASEQARRSVCHMGLSVTSTGRRVLSSPVNSSTLASGIILEYYGGGSWH